MKRLGYDTMRPLLVILERFGGPLGASLTALGASWGALGRVLRSSSGALGDVVGAGEPLLLKMSSWSTANTVKNVGWRNPPASARGRTCPSKEREARAVKNHEDIRR